MVLLIKYTTSRRPLRELDDKANFRDSYWVSISKVNPKCEPGDERTEFKVKAIEKFK